MKHKISVFIVGLGLVLNSCNDLDLLPLSEASTDSWYSATEELEMAANEFYKMGFWYLATSELNVSTDNFTYRNTNRTEILNGTLNGQTWYVNNMWKQSYKLITLTNTFLNKTENLEIAGVSEVQMRQYRAEAYFSRACKYAGLITFFGDVVYLDKNIYIEEALEKGRTPKSEVIPLVYADFDKAIDDLPVSYSTASKQRFTKGAAMAMKARFALYNGDWDVVEKMTTACMELGIYELHPDFSELFLTTTGVSKEKVFLIPRSVEFNVLFDGWVVNNTITRNATGYGSALPSWDLLASFLCTDGLPIDESPLFDPRNPFKNRDPRCTATIVEFNTPHLGFEFDPHPDALTVMNYNTGKMQTNNDNRAVAQYASFNGLVWKKGIDETWLQNGKKVAQDFIIMRYADVLLMYAEAKIEQGKIDETVLNAINQVRARAYGVHVGETDKYPAVTTTEQAELRQVVRLERRVEFANEGLRYHDVIRWKLASKLFKTKNYGLLYPADLLREKVTSQGLWFWPSTPRIGEDGLVDFSEMEKAGQIAVLAERMWDDRQYLWPIPTEEILINPNMKQNEGY